CTTWATSAKSPVSWPSSTKSWSGHGRSTSPCFIGSIAIAEEGAATKRIGRHSLFRRVLLYPYQHLVIQRHQPFLPRRYLNVPLRFVEGVDCVALRYGTQLCRIVAGGDHCSLEFARDLNGCGGVAAICDL